MRSRPSTSPTSSRKPSSAYVARFRFSLAPALCSARSSTTFGCLGCVCLLMRQSVQVLRSLNHKNIIKLYEIFEEDGMLLMIMELCTGEAAFHPFIPPCTRFSSPPSSLHLLYSCPLNLLHSGCAPLCQSTWSRLSLSLTLSPCLLSPSMRRGQRAVPFDLSLLSLLSLLTLPLPHAVSISTSLSVSLHHCEPCTQSGWTKSASILIARHSL